MSPVLVPLALLATSALAQEAAPSLSQEEPVSSGPVATLEITATKPAVAVARIEGRASSSGLVYSSSNAGLLGGGTATAWSTFQRDLCVTPCRVEIPAGLSELSFSGKGYRIATEKYTFQPGETRILTIKPGSFGLAYLSLLGTTLGLVSVATGGLFLALDQGADWSPLGLPTEAAMVGGGALLAGFGIWGMRSTRTIVTEVPAPALSLSYEGTF